VQVIFQSAEKQKSRGDPKITAADFLRKKTANSPYLQGWQKDTV